MPDPYSGISKSINKVASAVDGLKRSEETSRKSSERASRRMPVNVDFLTSEEIEELRALVEHGTSLPDFSASRISSGGQKVEGMYQEFSNLGICMLDMDGRIVLLSPMAYWAVEKSDQRARERKADRESQRRHDYALAVVTTLVGAAMTLLATVVTSAIN